MYSNNLYSREQVRDLDSTAIKKFNTSGKSLMQRAGEFSVSCINKYFPLVDNISVFCGSGNNGGDGFVVAKLLHKQGKQVDVYFLGDETKLTIDSRNAYNECKKFLNIYKFSNKFNNEPELIVDGIFGTGLNKDLDKNWIDLINLINNYNSIKVSLDIPSGLNANTGIPMPVAIKSDLTPTFVGKKIGLFTGLSNDYCGKVEFCDLDVPNKVYENVNPVAVILNISKELKNLISFSSASFKNTFGHIVVIGGNKGMLGASILSSASALRAGAGLVTVLTHKEHASNVPVAMPELMSRGVESLDDAKDILEKSTALIIGPGLGQDTWAKNLFNEILKIKKPIVIDADALNLLASHKQELSSNFIITPHPGEAARLLGITTEEVQKDRIKAAKNLVSIFKCIVVLKGAGTIVIDYDSKLPKLCPYGNVGMATAGMGDLLAGVIAGLCSRVDTLENAASLAVCVHAVAGDKEIYAGKHGMVATDLLKHIRLMLS